MASHSANIVAGFIECIDRLLQRQTCDPWRYLDEKALVQIVGSTPISGVYRGREEISHLLVALASRHIGNGTVRLLDTISEGESVGAFLVLRLSTPEGCQYNAEGDPAGCWFDVHDGKISEIRFFPDTTQVETQLFGRLFVLHTAGGWPEGADAASRGAP